MVDSQVTLLEAVFSSCFCGCSPLHLPTMKCWHDLGLSLWASVFLYTGLPGGLICSLDFKYHVDADDVQMPISSSVLSGYIPRNVIAPSYGNPIFSFLRNIQAVLHSGCPMNIPTNSVGGFPFLYILSSICYL